MGLTLEETEGAEAARPLPAPLGAALSQAGAGLRLRSARPEAGRAAERRFISSGIS